MIIDLGVPWSLSAAQIVTSGNVPQDKPKPRRKLQPNHMRDNTGMLLAKKDIWQIYWLIPHTHSAKLLPEAYHNEIHTLEQFTRWPTQLPHMLLLHLNRTWRHSPKTPPPKKKARANSRSLFSLLHYSRYWTIKCHHTMGDYCLIKKAKHTVPTTTEPRHMKASYIKAYKHTFKFMTQNAQFCFMLKRDTKEAIYMLSSQIISYSQHNQPTCVASIDLTDWKQPSHLYADWYCAGKLN